MNNWKEVLSSLAPTAATLLGGPFAGLAIGTLTKALGLSEPKDLAEPVKTIQDFLTNNQLTGDQLLKLKEAELEIQKNLSDNNIKLEDIAAKDRDSARNMQINTRSRVVPILATVTVVAFFGVVFWVLTGKVTLESTLLGFVLGQVSSKAEQVYNYFFGSSHGSDKKTDILANGK